MFSLLAFLFHLFSFTVSFVVRILFLFHLYIYIYTYLVQFVCGAMKFFRVCYDLYYLLRKCAQIHNQDFFFIKQKR